MWRAGITRNADRYLPTLNGEPQPLAVAADVHLGQIWLFVTNSAGDIERDDFGRPRTRIVRGQVELRRVRDE